MTEQHFRNSEDEPSLCGFGGWLYAVAAILLAAFGNAFITLIDSLLPFMFSNEFLTLTAKNSTLAIITYFDLARYVLFVLFVPYLGYLGFRQSEAFPKLMIIYFLINIPISLLNYAGTYAAPEKIARDTAQSALNGVILTIVLAAVWIPYFRKSRRVKNTFRQNNPS